MADNYLEKHRQDYEAAKARREAERKKRLRHFAEQYRKRKESAKDTPLTTGQITQITHQ